MSDCLYYVCRIVFRVYLCKQWQELKVLNDHTAAVTGIRFGKHAQYIAYLTFGIFLGFKS
ncbi:Pre-mRNA-processing factor 19 [Temnothorax longispinosus]|uniref:Pre-mRNA-processing factor 19 n=1 Tax=Temnothorax longispinosus TaxID=300112 RepID=A0A4V3S7T4_9HYME|nr:Pre-mRNA-processing factor 19 [Temnothorax longispinosus]